MEKSLCPSSWAASSGWTLWASSRMASLSLIPLRSKSSIVMVMFPSFTVCVPEPLRFAMSHTRELFGTLLITRTCIVMRCTAVVEDLVCRLLLEKKKDIVVMQRRFGHVLVDAAND